MYAHNAHTHARTHTVLVQHTHTCNTDQMRRLVRKPELGSRVHVVYWEVVDKAGIPHNTVKLKHLHRRTSQQISLDLIQHTFNFSAPATAKNSPSLSKSMLVTVYQLLGSPKVSVASSLNFWNRVNLRRPLQNCSRLCSSSRDSENLNSHHGGTREQTTNLRQWGVSH